MAVAFILIGIMTGMLSFGAALVAGQGLMLAFGFYILGGMAGVVVALLAVGLRVALRRVGRSGGAMVALRN